jgi:hypothetical protein
MCSATNSGNGVYARSIYGPERIGPYNVAFTEDVWFRDAAGGTGYGPGGNALARVRYRYSFLGSSVRAWIAVTTYASANGAGTPFVKEPKFVAVSRGSGYKRMAVFGPTPADFIKGVMLGQPETGSGLRTDHSADATRMRVRWDYGTSLTDAGGTACDAGPCFNVVMRAYPTSGGNIFRTGFSAANWENALGLGLNGWAVASATRPKSYARDTWGDGAVTSCSVPFLASDDLNGNGVREPEELSRVSERSNPGIDGVRRWEFAGWKDSGSGDANPNPYTAAITGFHGWEGGVGPYDCEPLEVAFGTPGETWGTYGSYSLGDGWSIAPN